MALSHQLAASIQPRPTLSDRRGAACPPLRVSAFHTSARSPSSSASSASTTSLPTSSSSSSPATTLYHVLQVPHTATSADIKASYRRLARLYHPDSSSSADDKELSTNLFLQLHAAYSALSDATTRAKYDLQLSSQALRAARFCSAAGTPFSVSRSPTPRGTAAAPVYVSRSPTPRDNANFSPYNTAKIGRNWETDQCWC